MWLLGNYSVPKEEDRKGFRVAKVGITKNYTLKLTYFIYSSVQYKSFFGVYLHLFLEIILRRLVIPIVCPQQIRSSKPLVATML